MKYQKSSRFKSILAFILIIATIFLFYYLSLHYYPNVAYFDEQGQLILNDEIYSQIEMQDNFKISTLIGEIKPKIDMALICNILVYRVDVDGIESNNIVCVIGREQIFYIKNQH